MFLESSYSDFVNFFYNSDVPARNGFLARNFAVKRENATASPLQKRQKKLLRESLMMNQERRDTIEKNMTHT